MPTTLQGIAGKAYREKQHRFGSLYGILNEKYLLECWKEINKKSAYGVDKVSAKDFEENLITNIKALVDDLKNKRYHAKLVKRVYIPKGDGKMRPLGIPSVSDKLVQSAASNILSTIYEEDFYPCSFGYRPKRGAKDAVKELSNKLICGKYNYIVDADIKGYFENINHDTLVRMLEKRVKDNAFIRLIRKWLNAGILDRDGKVTHPEMGTPQGGIISPLLANIYLHYVLDTWFHEFIVPRCRGDAYLIRYADDFVCCFQNKSDAEWFFSLLNKRLNNHHLSLSNEKSKLIPFSRFNEESECFTFLGFEFRWCLSRKGKRYIKKRTASGKLRKAVKTMKEWCKLARCQRLNNIFSSFNAKLRGHYNYFGIKGNYQSLEKFFKISIRILFRWLNRRSQRKSYTWKKFSELLKVFEVEFPHIIPEKKVDNCQLEFKFQW